MDSYLTRPVITLLLLGIVALATWLIHPILIPIVLAGVFTLLIYPIYSRLQKRFKVSDTIGAFIMVAGCSLLVLVPFLVGSAYIWTEFLTVYGKAYAMMHSAGLDNPSSSELWTNVQTVLHQYHIDDQAFLRTVLFPILNTINGAITGFFSNFIGRVVHVVVGLFVFLVTFFFLLRDGRRFVQLLEKLSPLTATETRHIFQTCTYVVEGLFLGNFLTALAQGAIGGFGFFIFKLPAPLFWGSVMSVVSLFPFVGPALVYAPATLFVYVSSGSMDTALMYLAYNILITSTIDNIIKPAVMGRHASVHPLVMFLALIAGVTVWGPIGIIYGPLVAALLLLTIDFYLEETKQRSLFSESKK